MGEYGMPGQHSISRGSRVWSLVGTMGCIMMLLVGMLAYVYTDPSASFIQEAQLPYTRAAAHAAQARGLPEEEAEHAAARVAGPEIAGQTDLSQARGMMMMGAPPAPSMVAPPAYMPVPKPPPAPVGGVPAFSPGGVFAATSVVQQQPPMHPQSAPVYPASTAAATPAATVPPSALRASSSKPATRQSTTPAATTTPHPPLRKTKSACVEASAKTVMKWSLEQKEWCCQNHGVGCLAAHVRK